MPLVVARVTRPEQSPLRRNCGSLRKLHASRPQNVDVKSAKLASSANGTLKYDRLCCCRRYGDRRIWKRLLLLAMQCRWHSSLLPQRQPQWYAPALELLWMTCRMSDLQIRPLAWILLPARRGESLQGCEHVCWRRSLPDALDMFENLAYTQDTCSASSTFSIWYQQPVLVLGKTWCQALKRKAHQDI